MKHKNTIIIDEITPLTMPMSLIVNIDKYEHIEIKVNDNVYKLTKNQIEKAIKEVLLCG